MNTTPRFARPIIAAALALAAAALCHAENESKTPRANVDALLALGKKAAKHTQLDLQVVADIEHDGDPSTPSTLKFRLLYDKSIPAVRLVLDLTLLNGSPRRVTILSHQDVGVEWIQVPPGKKIQSAVRIPALDTLPSQDRLPTRLRFATLFADALQGYTVTASEYSLLRPKTDKPDGDGLLWFALSPSANANIGTRKSFVRGTTIDIGIDATSGLLQRVNIGHRSNKLKMHLSVSEQKTTIDEEDPFTFPPSIQKRIDAEPKAKEPRSAPNPAVRPQPPGPKAPPAAPR